MKGLVVYESFFGNTAKVAEEIGRTLAEHAEVRALPAGEVESSMLEGIDFLVVGSPTRAFRATDGVLRFLDGLPAGRLDHVKAAAFDTRVDVTLIKSPLVRLFLGRTGHAAKPIAKRLGRRGAEMVAEPEGFFVTGTEGPLKEGEIERAALWARKIEEAAGV